MPSWRKLPAIFSESSSFIWHPKVSIKNFLAMGLTALDRAQRMIQHFARMPARCFGDSFAPQHPRQLLDPLRLVQALDRGLRPRSHRLFTDGIVMCGVGGNLREMSDTKYLVAARDGAKAAPDDFSHPAPDPDIHFVKY